MRYLKLFVVFATVAGSLTLAQPALAATPILSVSNQGGNNVTLTITSANPYSQITLYRQQSSSLWTTISNFGSTDGSGYFSQSMSLGSDGSNNPVVQYVVVGGLQSNTVSTYPYGGGCYGYNCGNNCYNNGYYNCGVGGLTLSPSSLNLNVGQSQSVQISSGVNMSVYSLYISGNTNSSVASAYTSGYQLNVTGNSNGSTTITVCLSGGSTCGQLYVTVGGYGGSGNVWFNPANPTMYVGQSLAVSINSSAYSGGYYGYNTAYYISSNSNSSVVSANVSGTALNLYANQSGSSTITVCNSGLNFCGNLFVTVTGSGSGSMTLSQTSVSLNVGQNMVVTAYGTSGNLYVSSNSNSSVATYSISGNQVTVYGSNNGSTNMSVCSTNGCVNLSVTVSGTCYSGYCGGSGTLSFSPSSLNMQVGQSTVVYAQNTGGNSLYLANNLNTSVVTTSISGNAITVYANNSGYTTINVCTNGTYQCGMFTVNVSGYGYGSGNVNFSQNYVNLTSNQSTNVTMYSSYNSGYNFYVSSNSNPSIVTASISGNTLYLYASGTWGTSNITVCQSGSQVGCGTLTVNVNGYSSGGGYGNFTVSQNNVTLTSGQSTSLTMNGNGSYTISSNSNPSVANATISGSLLNIYGSANGSTTMVVCQNNPYSCVNVYVTVSGSVLGGSTYRNGQLLNVNGTVYIVYKNTITAFANAQAFLGLGFSFANVTNVAYTNIPNSGYVISTANGAHPWGSWVKSNGTVYFVHESGLIPVGDYNTFLNNGGDNSLVVPANGWDFQRPMLSIMTYNDSRLK